MKYLLLLAASALVGIAKAGFGAGVGLAATPLMAMALPSTVTLGVLLPLLITGDVFALIHYRGKQNLRNLAMLVPGCALGVAVGAFMLSRFLSLEGGERALRVTIGAICIAFVALHAYKDLKARKGAGETAAYHPRIWHGVSIGFLAGVTSTLSHVAGPIIMMFLLPQKLDRQVFVGTALLYFLIGNLIKLAPYVSQHIITGETIVMSVKLMPFVIAGTVLGAWLNKRVSARMFTLIIYAVTLLSGLKLVLG